MKCLSVCFGNWKLLDLFPFTWFIFQIIFLPWEWASFIKNTLLKTIRIRKLRPRGVIIFKVKHDLNVLFRNLKENLKENFWLLNSKISQLKTLKLPEVFVSSNSHFSRFSFYPLFLPYELFWKKNFPKCLEITSKIHS